MSQGRPNQRHVAIVIESQEHQNQVVDALVKKGFVPFLLEDFKVNKEDHYVWIVGSQLVYNTAKVVTNGFVGATDEDVLFVDNADQLADAIEKYTT